MKTIKLFILGAIALLFFTTACIDYFTIRGNGIAATGGRITQNFNKVKSSGAFDVHIINGDEQEVVIIAEENLLQYIETFASNNQLSIDIKGMHNIKNRLPMEVYITTPNLESIKQSGSGIITTNYFTPDHLDISISGSGLISTAVDAIEIEALISGSGKLELSGVAKVAQFTISGSGKIDAYNLTLRDCEAKISGSGNISVNVERYLNASISGSGNLYYFGTPDIETHISGSGKVIQEN